MVAPEDEARRWDTAAIVNAFWQPQHLQKTEIEKEKKKEKENGTNKYSPNIGPPGRCSRRRRRLVSPEDKPG